jgi:hypothetical protein
MCASAEPARCAGLRHALLHDWRQGFPLQDSPFQVLARRLGGTLREVLGHCHALSDEGSLDAIRVHWSPALQRVRWRCGLRPDGRPGAELLASVAALPGVTGWDWIESVDDAADGGATLAGAVPDLWFDLVARDAAAARVQRDWFEARHGLVSCVALDNDGAAAGCDCARDAGPCTDPDLARHCEAGLPLVAHPYRAVSDALKRSEREVIATLRHWQRAGRVQRLALGGPLERAQTLWTVAAVAGAARDPGVSAALLARAGVAEVQVLPEREGGPPLVLVAASGASPQARGLLERALAACGLADRPRRLLQVQRVRLRNAPLLFARPGELGAPDPP